VLGGEEAHELEGLDVVEEGERVRHALARELREDLLRLALTQPGRQDLARGVHATLADGPQGDHRVDELAHDLGDGLLVEAGELGDLQRQRDGLRLAHLAQDPGGQILAELDENRGRLLRPGELLGLGHRLDLAFIQTRSSLATSSGWRSM
jgi:hypothetical protein